MRMSGQDLGDWMRAAMSNEWARGRVDWSRETGRRQKVRELRETLKRGA